MKRKKSSDGNPPLSPSVTNGDEHRELSGRKSGGKRCPQVIDIGFWYETSWHTSSANNQRHPPERQHAFPVIETREHQRDLGFWVLARRFATMRQPPIPCPGPSLIPPSTRLHLPPITNLSHDVLRTSFGIVGHHAPIQRVPYALKDENDCRNRNPLLDADTQDTMRPHRSTAVPLGLPCRRARAGRTHYTRTTSPSFPPSLPHSTRRATSPSPSPAPLALATACARCVLTTSPVVQT